MQNLKVIFHLSKIKDWVKTIGNIENLFQYLNSQNNIDHSCIEVLMNGEAVKILKDNTQILLKLNSLGVNIPVCNNSLENFNIDKNTLLDFINIVPVGVFELAIKQNNGYAYIKS